MSNSCLSSQTKNLVHFKNLKIIINISFPISNHFNIREKVKSGEEKTINVINFKRRMPRKSCWRKSAKV